MSVKTSMLLALAFAVATTTPPAFAQVATDKDSNAHHYQGGPQTAVPHSMKHPKRPPVRPPVAAITIAAAPRPSPIIWAKRNNPPLRSVGLEADTNPFWPDLTSCDATIAAIDLTTSGWRSAKRTPVAVT
jgi:hypothetical protein